MMTRLAPLLIVAAIFFAATPAHAAVAFDAACTADATADAVTSINLTTLTVGSGSNRALVAQINFSNQGITGLSVTWDSGGTNQAMTQIVAQNTNGATGRALLYGLIAPTSGNKTLAVSWTGSSDVVVCGVAYTGVDQTGGATSFPNSTSNAGNGTTGSVTVTSATGDAAVATYVALVAISSVDQTQVYIENAPANISGAGQRADGAASVAFTQTNAGSQEWVTIGTSVKASGGGGGAASTPQRSLLGVGQ